MRLYAAYCGSTTHHRGLRDARAAMGITNQIAHHALSDAKDTLEVVRHMASGVAPSLNRSAEPMPDLSGEQSFDEGLL